MSEEVWIWRCDRVIPSDTAVGRHVLEELLGELASRGWSEHDIFHIHLATEEALVNAIKHGNRSDRSKTVHIRCQLSAELIRIEIADEGFGFDPARVPDPTDPERLETPGGRGVMLMKAFMSRVEYSPAGNSVVLQKRRGSSHHATRNEKPAG